MPFFYKGELEQIAVSMFTITLAFSMAFFKNVTMQGVFIVLGTVGIGFFAHEMGHKFTAMRYGAVAMYKMWLWGLVMAVFLAAATGFVFAAPGAVYIWKEHLTKKENGIISLAGPLMNVLLAGLFFYMIPFLGSIASTGFYINLFLAGFNLLPMRPLDGSKVYAYSPVIWGMVFFPLLALYLMM